MHHMRPEPLPSIIRETEFDSRGFAVSEAGLLVPAYVGCQQGFATRLNERLQGFYDRLREEAHVLPLCPFTACAEYLDLETLNQLETRADEFRFWDTFNRHIGPVNYGTLMPYSKMMIADLDGSHGVDDGLSAEIAHYATRYMGSRPLVGIRSDVRLAENLAAPINPAVRYFLDQGPYNGLFFQGPFAEDEALEAIAGMAEKMIVSFSGRDGSEIPGAW